MGRAETVKEVQEWHPGTQRRGGQGRQRLPHLGAERKLEALGHHADDPRAQSLEGRQESDDLLRGAAVAQRDDDVAKLGKDA